MKLRKETDELTEEQEIARKIQFFCSILPPFCYLIIFHLIWSSFGAPFALWLTLWNWLFRTEVFFLFQLPSIETLHFKLQKTFLYLSCGILQTNSFTISSCHLDEESLKEEAHGDLHLLYCLYAGTLRLDTKND